MAKLRNRAGSSSQSFYVKLLDNAATNGAGKTGLVNTDVTAAYVPYQGLSLPVTLNGSLATPDAAFSAGGFIEVEATRHPGLYRVDIDDAAFTTAPSVIVTIVGAGIVDVDAEYQLDDMAEPSSVPAANVSLEEKINWLFMLARNQIEQTSTTQTLRADDTTTQVATSTTSDAAGTFTRGEWTP